MRFRQKIDYKWAFLLFNKLHSSVQGQKMDIKDIIDIAKPVKKFIYYILG